MKERGGKKDERSAISGKKIHRKIKKSKKDKEVKFILNLSNIYSLLDETLNRGPVFL